MLHRFNPDLPFSRVGVQRAEVHRGDHRDPGEIRVPAALVPREEPSEAVADQNHAARVDAVLVAVAASRRATASAVSSIADENENAPPAPHIPR